MVPVKIALHNIRRLLLVGSTLILSACGQFHRVPPGNSLGVAMARRPVVLAMPVAASVSHAVEDEVGGGDYSGPSVEPSLPSMDMADVPSLGVEVDDPAVYLVKGDQLRESGNPSAAIQQYQDAVKADPTFTLAWRNLALTYQEVGDDANALAAFRQYKTYAGE